jgi:spermidine synthase
LSARKTLVLTFLFLSGATGLVYELVWSKYLSNLLGNSGQAHAIVLASFMGGLALGAYLFGGLADRVKSPLRLYGLLELGVGVYALLFPAILGLSGALYLKMAAPMSEGVRVVPKLVLASLSLLPPTLLMGGTLPALARHFTESLSGMQKELSRLYAVNSLGASFGVFLAGVRLVPNFGLAASAYGAAAVNLALAAGAVALSRERRSDAPITEPEAIAEYPRAAVRAALVGSALSGFTAMLYEITWIRLLSIVLGGTTYAFTLILTTFILGIGLGSFWLMRRKASRDSLRLFGWLQVFLVLGVCLALPLYVRLPHYFMVAYHGLNRTLDTWPWFQFVTFGFCAAVLLIPTFFMGAGFPAVARVATSKVAELGKRLGGVYLWNTMGTVSGSLLGGLVLLPWLGMEGNFAIGIAFNIVAAAIAFAFAPQRPKSAMSAFWPVAMTVVCAGVYLSASSGWSEFVADAGGHREWGKPFDSFEAYYRATRKDVQVKFREDDIFATVLVGEAFRENHRYMRINGKVDASNGGDAQTQILAGHLGVLLHPREVKKVLVVGAGAAITVGSVLAHPVERVDLVEISPAVMKAAALFAGDNRHALEDPRVVVHIDDAKSFMALANEKYDLIVSVPSNPWVTGVSGLFSRDFFQLAKEHLTEDGLVVQWIHTYLSSEEMIALVFRTLRDSFPHATTWGGPLDLVMVASREEIDPELATLQQRLTRAGVKEDLGRVDIPDLVTLLAKQVHSDQGQAEFAGKGPINTDDLNLLEYGSPVAYYVAKDLVRVRDERRAPDGGQRLFIQRLLKASPLTAAQVENIYRNLSKSHSKGDPLVRSAAERWLQVAPNDVRAARAMAMAAVAQNDLHLAKQLWAPGNAEPFHNLEEVATYLRLVTKDSLARRSALNPVPVPEGAIELARTSLEHNSAHAELKAAVADLCAALRPEACEQGRIKQVKMTQPTESAKQFDHPPDGG